VPTRSEKIGAEFVGTFILVLSVVCAGAQPAQAALAPFAVVGVITGLIFAFGHISGAIFNPAVSIALILRGRLGVQEALEFAVAQLLAAIAASLTGRVLYGVSIAPSISAPLAVANWLRAALSEVLWTGIIVTMVLHAGTTKAMEGNDVAPVAIMMAVFGCIVCASGASAAGFNPAACTGMWLAKAMTGGGFSAYHVSLYFVGPIVGSVLATALFKTVTCPNEK
jgi:aquaporin Z